VCRRDDCGVVILTMHGGGSAVARPLGSRYAVGEQGCSSTPFDARGSAAAHAYLVAALLVARKSGDLVVRVHRRPLGVTIAKGTRRRGDDHKRDHQHQRPFDIEVFSSV
jgi:hypothetical protein